MDGLFWTVTTAASAVVFWLGFCWVNARIAREKNRDVSSAWLLSLLVSPILAFLYYLAVPAKTPRPPEKPRISTGEPWELTARRISAARRAKENNTAGGS